jgi:hypothetical protein
VLVERQRARTTASTTEKMAVLAPIPSVSTTRATAVTDIEERKERNAAFRSSRMPSSFDGLD